MCSVQQILSQAYFAKSIKALRSRLYDLLGHNVPTGSIDRTRSPDFHICLIRLNFGPFSLPDQIVPSNGLALAQRMANGTSDHVPCLT